MELQPVLPENFDLATSKMRVGIFPVAVSEGRTACRYQAPPSVVESDSTGVELATMTESLGCFSGPTCVWQAARETRQMAAMNFMTMIFIGIHFKVEKLCQKGWGRNCPGSGRRHEVRARVDEKDEFTNFRACSRTTYY